MLFNIRRLLSPTVLTLTTDQIQCVVTLCSNAMQLLAYALSTYIDENIKRDARRGI
jgi:hypothetical protein